MQACDNKHEEVLKLLIASGADLNVRNKVLLNFISLFLLLNNM